MVKAMPRTPEPEPDWLPPNFGGILSALQAIANWDLAQAVLREGKWIKLRYSSLSSPVSCAPRERQVVEITGSISRSTLWRLVKKRVFPQPFKLTDSVWNGDAFLAWLVVKARSAALA